MLICQPAEVLVDADLKHGMQDAAINSSRRTRHFATAAVKSECGSTEQRAPFPGDVKVIERVATSEQDTRPQLGDSVVARQLQLPSTATFKSPGIVNEFHLLMLKYCGCVSRQAIICGMFYCFMCRRGVATAGHFNSMHSWSEESRQWTRWSCDDRQERLCTFSINSPASTCGTK